MRDRENTHGSAHRRKGRTQAYPLLGALLALALTTLLGACSGTSTLQSVALLKAAQDKFNAAKSFHFVMQADNLGTAPQDVLNVKNAEGDVQRPDKLSATGYVTLNGLGVNTKIVIIGGKAWYQLPIFGFQEDDSYADFIQIFDSQKGVGNLLPLLKNPSAPQDSSVNNVSCWKITGDVDPHLVSTLLGADASAGANPKVSVCIGKSDNQLYSAVVVGSVIQGDKTNTTRSFYLSKYDQPVTIEPPTN
jgi:LppX_LprAFG lipoprotein